MIAIGTTVVGGLLLAFIFFLLKDFIFKLPALSGLWRFESETQNTSYNPYRGMTLTYLVLLWQEGHTIYGSGEKVREDVNGTVRTYTGAQRSRIDIRGYLTKGYFRKSEIVLHFTEHAEKRPSSTMQTLRITGKGMMRGTYASTIANSSGTTRWTRGADGLTFEGLV